jgi:hypothetical protein
MVYLPDLPETSEHPLIGEKRLLSRNDLKKEAMKALTEKGLTVIKMILHGSILHHTEDNRGCCNDADFIVITNRHPATINIGPIILSDGTRCDFIFTIPQVKYPIEATFASLMGERWTDEESTDQPWTNKSFYEIYKEVHEAYGSKVHNNLDHIIKSSHKGEKYHYCYQIVRMMLVLMLLYLKRHECPVYNALEFLPSTFTKRKFSRWMELHNFDPEDVVLLFTRQQLVVINGVLKVKSLEKKYMTIIDGVPEAWKAILISFKQNACEASSQEEICRDLANNGISASVRILVNIVKPIPNPE